MLTPDECLPTALFPPSKRKFLELSDDDSCSIPSETALSQTNSLNEIQDFSTSDFLMQSKSSEIQGSFDAPVAQLLKAYSSPIQQAFPEQLYERINDFLDQEGLFISVPNPFPKPRRTKPSMTVVLSTNLHSRSELSTVIDTDSPFSDCQSLPGPTFLVRRTISGGFKSKATSLIMTQMKSEPLPLDVDSTPFTANYAKRFGSEMINVHNEELNEIDSLE